MTKKKQQQNIGWIESFFGYCGLPLMLVVGGGIFCGIVAGTIMFLIWGIMFVYSYIKFSDKEN